MAAACYTPAVSEPTPPVDPSRPPAAAPPTAAVPAAAEASEPAAPAAPAEAASAEAAAPDEAEAALPPPPSRFARWRKRGAPLVLFIAIGVLAHETCKSDDRRAVTLQLDLGRDAGRVQELWVDVFVEGESVAQYRQLGGARRPQLEARLSGEAAEVRIELLLAPLAEGGEATRRLVTRRVRGEGGSTVTLPLSDELAK